MNAIEIADASLLAPEAPRARQPKRKPKPPREPKRGYEVRYFKDERGRSVQLRRCVTLGLEGDWEPIPSFEEQLYHLRQQPAHLRSLRRPPQPRSKVLSGPQLI